MAHYGRLDSYRFNQDVDDIRGSSLYGLNDEKLGKIEDVIFDHSSGAVQYAVVDSGGWFSHKRFLVAADHIQPYGKNSKDFYVGMTKQQIEALPRYEDQNDRDWSDYNRKYHESLETSGGVLHREMSAHMITPDPSELPATGEPLPDEDYLQPQRLESIFTDTSPNSSKNRLRPSGLATRAEDSAVAGESVPEEIPTRLEEEELNREAAARNQRAASSERERDRTTGAKSASQADESGHPRLAAFEDHLRRNRVDITASCRSCGVREDKDKVA